MPKVFDTHVSGRAIFVKKYLAAATELPKVKFIDCQDPGLSFFYKCLVVESKGTTQFAGLFKVDGFENILQGALFTRDGKEKDGSRVSVSIKTKAGGALVRTHTQHSIILSIRNKTDVYRS